MSCFSVTDPFLTIFYYVEKQNGILHKNRGEGFEKSYVPLHRGGEGGNKNCQNHPYVINEMPLAGERMYLKIDRGPRAKEGVRIILSRAVGKK